MTSVGIWEASLFHQSRSGSAFCLAEQQASASSSESHCPHLLCGETNSYTPDSLEQFDETAYENIEQDAVHIPDTW